MLRKQDFEIYEAGGNVYVGLKLSGSQRMALVGIINLSNESYMEVYNNPYRLHEAALSEIIMNPDG